MKTKLTVIVDNIATDPMEGEWGLSILVEHGDTMVLVDAGASDLFVDNLEKLGFDIKRIGYATLSHAHYDHANGMPRFLKENEKANLYIRETTEANCYFKKLFVKKYIGIPKTVMTDYQNRIVTVSGDYQLCDDIWLIPHKTAGLKMLGKREMMYKKIGRKWVPDDFSHEQSVVIDTEKGLVIINSCSHGGAENIINEVRETFPDKHIHALIGGLHLFNKSEEEIRCVSKSIADSGIDRVCTGHCTKNRAFHIMKEELGDRVEQFRIGMEIIDGE